jgi:hypothetical protein
MMLLLCYNDAIVMLHASVASVPLYAFSYITHAVMLPIPTMLLLATPDARVIHRSRRNSVVVLSLMTMMMRGSQ